MTHWTYDTSIDPLEYQAFVYRVTNKTTGEFYYGYKPVYQMKAKKIHRESDWSSYVTSSLTIHKEIAINGIAAFDWEILEFCVSNFHARWLEAQMVIKCDGLTNPLCLNNNVMITANANMVKGFGDPVRIARYKKDIEKGRRNAGLLKEEQ